MSDFLVSAPNTNCILIMDLSWVITEIIMSITLLQRNYTSLCFLIGTDNIFLNSTTNVLKANFPSAATGYS